MTAATALPCPKCRRALEAPAWQGADLGACPHCRTAFEFVAFPALQAPRRQLVAKAVLVAEQATCFFHAENQAETVCDGCGRFLCAVCAVDYSGQSLCPGCIAEANSEKNTLKSCVRYDRLALGLAFFTVLLWPITAVTAPLALGFVIFGWRKPRSLVQPGPAGFIVAGVVALIQVIFWVAVVVTLGTRKA